jgi:predicted signal transduction protein with EAL and GGDEF domain
MYPSDGTDMQTLTKNADTQVTTARLPLLYQGDQDSLDRTLTLESVLRRALKPERASLHYQPKIDMASGQMIESRRSMHPEPGTMPPAQFIRLAE